MAEEQLVVFLLGKEEYGISISQVREIIQHEGATKIPNRSDYMEGIINLRGKIIPLVDLSVKFGTKKENAVEQRAIIIETAGQELGIIVDAVTEVLKLNDMEIDSVPVTAASYDYVRGLGKKNGRLLVLLDVERLFDSRELVKLQEAIL